MGSKGKENMHKLWTGLLLGMLITCPFLLCTSQLTTDVKQDRMQWEVFLKKAEIIRYEDIGEGITKPKRVYMQMGDKQASGCWKNPQGVQKGYKEGWQYEIAAYELDKYLGMSMVPPTVERRFRSRKGSLQLWIDLEYSELERTQQDIPIPEEKQSFCENMIFLARAFDSLIGNIDRTQQNIRWTEDWRLILIDHSRSFRTKRLYTDQLIYGSSGLRKSMGFERLPREFVQKVRSLNHERLRQIAGPYLTYTEIEAVVKRKKLLLKEIDRMIEEHGEQAVLY